ncbi:MAG: hypothetical protein LBD75_02210 [Candidatus Peribacteria bacterium]|jgi:hypothetical protein|nr:hypothetical protein [Candidatus Peribacteria bacterium]
MQTLGRGYYIGLLAFLFIIRLLMLRYRKEHIKQSLEHLKVDCSRTKDVWKHLKEQGRGSQLFFWIACIVIVVFTVFAGIDSFSFPTFADDAFGNWNAPALHIFYDGGVKMFGELSEILGRGRLGYPIHIPLYKAQIATMMGGRYEMGINVLNFLLFIVLIKLSFLRTWEKTKKAVISILPALLIVGLPLVFFHITDSYMEFPSAVFSVLTVRFLYRYLEEKELGNIVLAALFGALLAFTKNDGIIVYLSSIIIVFLGILLGSKQFGAFLRSLWEKRRYFWSLVGILIFFYFPFLALKMWYGLGYNQSV